MNAAPPRLRLAPGSGAIIQNIDSESDIPAAIAFAEQIGAHHRAHLLRQRLAGRIGLFEIFRDTSARTFKRFMAAAPRGPMLLVVGADDGLNDSPEAWPLAERAVSWARAITLHGTGATIETYELAVLGAVTHGRGLLVECTSAGLPGWERLALASRHRPAVLKLIPSDGVHPVEAAQVRQ